MDIIYITIPVTLLFIATGVLIFFWASKSGQFDDLEGPAHRILFDDDVPENKTSDEKSNSDKPQ
ncbi:MAG: cbb3-type cytochrome oxidase assembly protein CcoS [Oceanospirillaceae bacterium]|nr:cbb3-type cytochrome oxidase assembly protein CcoS [Oceanospirillaceae bacterium]